MPAQNGGPPLDYEVVLREPQAVLRKQLGDGLRLVDFESTAFMKAGDNYGSTILKVRAVIKRASDEDDEEEALDLVAKMLPPTDFQRAIFESGFTFKKEIFLYEDLVPTYRGLYGGPLDVTPGFYGSRLSLRADAREVDEDALILLENLKVRGYYMEDRHKGLFGAFAVSSE